MAKIAVTVEISPAGPTLPTSFTIGSHKFMVTEALDGWHGEDYSYHKVMADDGNLYILKHAHDGWELIMMETGQTDLPAQRTLSGKKEAGG